MIQLRVNGELRQFSGPLAVADLLGHLELTGKRVAVELNGDIVPKSQHIQTLVQDGDSLEIVVAVGGG